MDARAETVVREAVQDALRQPPGTRQAWIRDRCRGDPAAATLLRLVEDAEQAGAGELQPRDSSQRVAWANLADALVAANLGAGATVGRYVVLHAVGEGGMGVVYAAWDPELDRKVALKLLHAGTYGAHEAMVRLRREAQAMARLTHPNVIAVHDVGTWEGRIFVAMEFVEGRQLDTWQQADSPGWKEVVDVYRQAGRGLAAAHGAGMVHRDFKPQNVLIGKDGGVRVLDFGLARSVRRPAGEAAGPPAAPGGSPLPQLTVEGYVAGTPAYMSPEQLYAEEPDPRSDQFNFCVALYEALWQQHPYPRPSPFDPIPAGTTPQPPAHPAVPGWVRRAVLRGLSLDPAERWPDMQSLIDALGDDPARKRARWLIAAGLAVVAVGAVVLLRPASGSFCQGADARFQEAWSPARRADLQRAFVASGAERSGVLFERTAAILDRYAAGWVGQRTEACEATHVRGEQSAELLDLRMACLDRRRDELAALVDVLSRGEAEVVSRATDAALRLEPLSTCADAALLRAPAARPKDTARLRALETGETRLAAIRAEVDTGREASARAGAEELVAEAVRLGFAPFEAEARYTLADLVERLGEFDAAVAEAFRSWTAAERGGHEEYRVRSLSLLVWIDGNDRSRFADAERWAALGQAALGRIGGGGALGAELHNSYGAALQTAGRAAEAFEQHQRALAFRTRAFGAESYEVAKSLNNLGSVRYTESRFEEALAYYRRSAHLLEPLLGVHPATALALSNVGATLTELRRAEPAREVTLRALEMRRELFGADSLWPALSEVNLALSDLLDRPANALPHIEHAEKVLGTSVPPGHPFLALPLSLRGRYLLAMGRPAEAAVPLARALAISVATGAIPYELATARFLLAQALWPSQPLRTRELVEEARKGLEALHAEASPLGKDVAAWLASHPTPR